MRRTTALVSAVLLSGAGAFSGWAASTSGGGAPQGQHKEGIPAGCRTWRDVPSPGEGILLGVDGFSSTDVWAVGDNGGLYPLVQRWDGRSWRQRRQTWVEDGSLFGVAAVAPDDVWAVGYLDQAPDNKVLTEHWDGTRWRLVRSPSPGTNDYVYDASAAGGDVWLAGNYIPKGSPTLQPLYMRWNGTRWRHVREAPGLTNGGIILGMDVRTSDDAWAVGYQGTETPFLNAPLIEHWDGTAWSIVPSPQPEGGSSALTEVSAVSANDAWAVGYDSQGPLIQHWDGTAWSRVAAPGTGYLLEGVAAISSDDVWAVGSGASSIHWDGKTWTFYPTPGDPLGGPVAVTAISPTDIWAVGQDSNGTITLHSKGVCP